MGAAPAWLDELDLRADGPPWLAMGLRRGGEDAWLVADDLRDAERAERRRLLADRWDEVVHLGPGTEAAGEEVRSLVTGWLHDHGLPAPERTGEHPLVEAARAVQEDLCLMVPRTAGPRDAVVRHHLDAAVLCFPSHWRLRDKAGGSALAIHGPVPGYDVELADRVDRYLARLRPDVIGVRRNWSIHDSPALHAPDPPASPPALDPATVGEALWLRSERQTLRALPRSGAVVFTIRVQQCPFSALAERPDVAAALARRLRAQPPALVAMNGVERRVDAVTAWLDAPAPRP
ncbi:DUF3445 domain-containing protein [Iamia sp. SCSIO 61187]|uniref:heme-dependent oxidative N-demethylase family protein n=1 Tax=Iamia sp. SCSIO 61187 TaxID=2722752 RepID=UPI001C637C56|nr:DUF3445 domain-containing protein [Iamia sp. SCSIO 61187]QYG92545.1 DUF3445 domain-containing protein [Iamia sp. SCSIO 61187]